MKDGRTTTGSITDLPSRIRDKIVIDSNGCWIWRGFVNDNGYGLVYLKEIKRQRRAHRVVYGLLRGAIPDGLHLDHLCRVRACCNPDHLEPVTPRVNTLRGETIPAAKLKQTHCIHGHELTGENLYIHKKRGTRNCRTCMMETARQRRLGSAGVCEIEGCDRPKNSRGLCGSHYMKLWKAKIQSCQPSL